MSHHNSSLDRTELEALRRDAERYRFLRDKASPSDVETWWWSYLGQAETVSAEKFDEIIDAAMAEQL